MAGSAASSNLPKRWNRRMRAHNWYNGHLARSSLVLADANELIVGGTNVKAPIDQRWTGQNLTGIKSRCRQRKMPDYLAGGARKCQQFAGGRADVDSL